MTAKQLTFSFGIRELCFARRLWIEMNHVLACHSERRRVQQPVADTQREHLSQQLEIVVDRHRRALLRASMVSVRLDVARRDLGDWSSTSGYSSRAKHLSATTLSKTPRIDHRARREVVEAGLRYGMIVIRPFLRGAGPNTRPRTVSWCIASPGPPPT